MEKNLLVQIKESLSAKPYKGSIEGVRPLKKGKPGKRIKHFYSRKNNAHLQCESRLEYAYALFNEFDNTVVKYRHQPVTLTLDGFKYTPDSLLLKINGLYELTEVKPYGRTHRDSFREKIEIVKEHCESFGVSFNIITEHDVCQKPDLKNREYLYRCIRHPISNYELEQACDVLQTYLEEPAPIRTVRKLFQSKNINPTAVEHLLAQNLLVFDSRFLLHANTLIFTGGEK